MMTLREQLAEAFPLHFQRICNLINQQNGDLDAWLSDPAFDNGGDALAGCVNWRKTEEGWEYWSALAEGAGLKW